MKENFGDYKIEKMASDYPEIKYKRIYEQVSYLKPHWRKNKTNAQFNELITQMMTQLTQKVKVSITINDEVKCEDKIQTRASGTTLLQQQQQQREVKKTRTAKINVPVSPLVTSTTNYNEELRFNIPTTDNNTKNTVTLVLNMPRIMCDALHTNMISLDAGSNDGLVNIMTPRVRYLFDVQEQNELSSAINVLEQFHVKENTTTNQPKTNKKDIKITKKRGRPKKDNVVATTIQATTTTINSETQAVANTSLTTFYENIDWLINSPSATPCSMLQVSSTTPNLNTNADMQLNQAAATYVVNFTNDGMQFTLTEGPLNFTTDNNNAIIQGNDTTNLPNNWQPNIEMQVAEGNGTFQPLTCVGPGPMLNNFGEPYESPLDKAFKAAISMPELNNETAASNENLETEKDNKSTNEIPNNFYEFLDKNINLVQNEEKINDNVWSGLLCNEDVMAFAAEAEAVNRNMELMADINEILDKSSDNKGVMEAEGDKGADLKQDEKYLKKEDIKQLLDLEDEILDFEDDDVLSLTASPLRDLEEFEEKNEQECKNNVKKYEEGNVLRKFRIPKLSQNTITTTSVTTTTTQNMQWTEKLSTNTTFKNLLNDCSYEMPKRIKNDTLTTSTSTQPLTTNYMQDIIKQNNSIQPVMCNKVQQQEQHLTDNSYNTTFETTNNQQECLKKAVTGIPLIASTPINFVKTMPSTFSFNNQCVQDVTTAQQIVNKNLMCNNIIAPQAEDSLSADKNYCHSFSKIICNDENIATTNNIQETIHLSDVQNTITKPCMNNKKFIIPEDFKIVKTIANNAAQETEAQLDMKVNNIAETHTLKIAKLFGIDCWLNFIGECTVNNNCGRNHQMRSLVDVQLAMSLLDVHDLERTYRFVFQYSKLYEIYIGCFCQLWAQRRDVERLMHLSMDCQLYASSVRTVFVEHICPALMQCGMHPVVICRELLKRLRRNPSNEMLKVLLDLIMECGQWSRFVPDIERILSYQQLDIPLNIVYEMIRCSEAQPSNWEIRNLTFKCLLKLKLENLAQIQNIPFILKFVQTVQHSAS